MQSSDSLSGRSPLYDGARSLPALVIRKYSTSLTGLGSGKDLGRALQERLRFRLQRAPLRRACSFRRSMVF